jgi:hypothetical protein
MNSSRRPAGRELADPPLGKPAPVMCRRVEYPHDDSDEEQQPEPFDLEAVNCRLAALGNGQP